MKNKTSESPSNSLDLNIENKLSQPPLLQSLEINLTLDEAIYEQKSFTCLASDGTKLYYEISGMGPVDFLLCDGIGCDGFIWPYLKPYLQEVGRVIHLHMRGHGHSAPPANPQQVNIADLARDWQTVLQHIGSRPSFILGHSMGVQVCLELVKQAPHLSWSGIILLCGTFEHTPSHFHNTQMLERILPLLRKTAKIGGKQLRKVWRRMVRFPLNAHLARFTEMSSDLSRKRDIENYLFHLSKMDPQVFLAMLSAAAEHSARTYLADIHTPTLIIAGEKDNFTPAYLSKEMQALLPNAQLHIIHQGTHAAPIENTIEVNTHIRHFIHRLVA
jgi:pimeloyl-ACP methyl ester carboxylesterase